MMTVPFVGSRPEPTTASQNCRPEAAVLSSPAHSSSGRPRAEAEEVEKAAAAASAVGRAIASLRETEGAGAESTESSRTARAGVAEAARRAAVERLARGLATTRETQNVEERAEAMTSTMAHEGVTVVTSRMTMMRSLP